MKHNQTEEGHRVQLLSTHKLLLYSYSHLFTLSRCRLAAQSNGHLPRAVPTTQTDYILLNIKLPYMGVIFLTNHPLVSSM